MSALTTDSYGVDEYCKEHNVSRFTAIIRMNVPEEDRTEVGLYAMYLNNTGAGRPSDAAYSAVRDYQRDPQSILNRESGCAA